MLEQKLNAHRVANDFSERLVSSGMIRESSGFDWPNESPDSTRSLSVFGAAFATRRLIDLGLLDKAKLQEFLSDEEGVK